MAIQGVSAQRPAAPAANLGTGHAKTVAQAFQQSLPTLFNDGEKKLSSQVAGRPFQVAAQSGNDKKGSVTLSYTVKDEASARALAKNLQGKWQSDDESWVGDNVSLPDADMLTGFKAKAAGNRLQVTLQWEPSDAGGGSSSGGWKP